MRPPGILARHKFLAATRRLPGNFKPTSAAVSHLCVLVGADMLTLSCPHQRNQNIRPWSISVWAEAQAQLPRCVGLDRWD